jgi:succinate dehydrogenase / fumarate reductase flavoprotein subunit
MQGLADGYVILPYTLAGYLDGARLTAVAEDGPEARGAVADVGARVGTLLGLGGRRTATHFHRALGRVLWEACGIDRSREGLAKAIDEVAALREAFWQDLALHGETGEMNQELERAGRVADFLELGELMCLDALHREESCGGHFREEYQTEDGEARRDDERFAYVAAWEYTGDLAAPRLSKEPLEFEYVHLAQRSYK